MILFMVLAATGVPAAQSGRMPIAVADLEATGVRVSDARTLTNQLHTELFRTGIFDILERQEMATVLREQGFQQAGCVSTECIVEMGQLVGVRQIVAGNIGKLGGKYILNVRMVDVSTGRVLATSSESCTCPLEDLTSTIEKVALALSGVERRERITVKFSKNRSIKKKEHAHGHRGHSRGCLQGQAYA
jgi:TolB-like protein